MNIGLFHPNAGRVHAGGKAVFVREMASALTTTAHTPVLYTEGQPGSDIVTQLQRSGVSVVCIPRIEHPLLEQGVETLTPFQRRTILTHLSAARWRLFSRIDSQTHVVCTHAYLDDLVLSNVLDTPTIYQYHNIDQVGPGGKAREAASQSVAHLANSKRIASEVAETFDRRVDSIIYPGVDSTRFVPAAEPPFEEESPVILFVGRIVEAKGIFDLVSALGRLETPATLYVAGNGDSQRLGAHARNHGVRDQLTLLGEVPHEELPGYYAGCDVFCNPTHYEGFGMVNIEAMACGAPIVSSELGGVTEYATHEETALLVSPGDPALLADTLEELLGNPAKRAALGTQARETAQRYTWREQAQRLGTVCESVVE